jgi:large conductance mechanosensitive channel
MVIPRNVVETTLRGRLICSTDNVRQDVGRETKGVSLSMKNFLKEFKDFIATGNMIELAVAVILGGAIGAVIKSFTDGIMMQIVAAIFGQPDFSAIKITLRENVGEVKDPVTGEMVQKDAELLIGSFINTLITLVLTGLVLFMMVKAYNRMKKSQAEEAPAGPTEAELLTEIRDLLRNR